MNTIPRLDPAQNFAADEFRHLLDFLDSRQYGVAECWELKQSRTPGSIAFRYDVHLRDVRCTYGFLRVHHERLIPGNFFLHHGYSAAERAAEADFKALAAQLELVREAGANVQLGFHDSPVDRCLQWKFADGDEKRYVAWLSSEDALVFFRELASSARVKESFDAMVRDTFVAAVADARRELGPFRLSAGHGGKLSQVLRPKLAALGQELASTISACFAENWMNASLLEAAGLEGDVELFKRQVPEVTSITEGGGRITQMCQALERNIQARRPMVALIHPATWRTNDGRDAEWSQLLALPPRKARVFLSATDATLEAEMAKAGRMETVDIAVYAQLGSGARRASLGPRARLSSFMDLLQEPSHARRDYEVELGPSLARYGELIAASMAGCLSRTGAGPDANSELPQRAQSFASWLTTLATPALKPPLSISELEYFLFSSSVRAAGITRAISHFLGGRVASGIDEMVDHGTGIALVPLVVQTTLPVKRVFCSEIKHSYIFQGSLLWQALGLESRIEYQCVSAVDFVYPTPVDVILFGQMLYRLPRDVLEGTLRRAAESLRPGGMLVINEIMNRPDLDGSYETKCLTSAELFSYLQSTSLELHSVDASRAELQVLPAAERPAAFFARSDNILVATKRASAS